MSTDKITTMLGMVAAIAAIVSQNIPEAANIAGLIGAVALGAWGWFTNKGK